MIDSSALPSSESDTGSGAAFAPAMPQQPAKAEQVSFTGSGSEYFGIWIVNILLSIITLGIYSAWAKVRKARYFYDNTHLAGASFEYHGNPIAILKGRIIAIVLVVGYQLAFKVNLAIGFAALGLLMAVMPWLIWKSLQFKLFNSSYRGIRFGFKGSAAGAYLTYLVMPLVSLVTLYLALPFAHQRMKKFQHEESRFGSTQFSFHATVGNFYVIYLIGFAVMIAGLIAIGIAFAGTFAGLVAAGGIKGMDKAALGSFLVFIFVLYAWIFMLFPLFLTLTQNLVWSNTTLGNHQFKSEMKWTKMFFIAFTNVLGIVCTLGLFTPFAQVRSMKYRLESISMLPDGSLDNFLADAQQSSSAVTEGMADLLDFDISM